MARTCEGLLEGRRTSDMFITFCDALNLTFLYRAD
jgi:hypothetical protein